MSAPHSKQDILSQQHQFEMIISATKHRNKTILLTSPIPFEQYKFNLNEINSKLYSDVFLFKHRLFIRELVEYCSNNPLDSSVAHTNCANAYKVNSFGFFLGKGLAIIISELSTKAQIYIVLGFMGFIILFKAIRFNYFIGAGLIFIISQLFF